MQTYEVVVLWKKTGRERRKQIRVVKNLLVSVCCLTTARGVDAVSKKLTCNLQPEPCLDLVLSFRYLEMGITGSVRRLRWSNKVDE